MGYDDTQLDLAALFSNGDDENNVDSETGVPEMSEEEGEGKDTGNSKNFGSPILL
jgi:hypothetical protein